VGDDRSGSAPRREELLKVSVVMSATNHSPKALTVPVGNVSGTRTIEPRETDN